MRPCKTTLLTLWCLASDSSEIPGSSDARVEMNQAEKTQEDARKCGDMLLIAEAMLEIVNEHNREALSQLDVRIGVLCCAFFLPSYCRRHWSVCRATVEGTVLLSSFPHVNPVYFSRFPFPMSIRSTFLCFPDQSS